MRWFRHLFSPSARRLFPTAALEHITAEIAKGELRHTGEVMFAVEENLELRAVMAGVSARTAACEAFARLRTWDTAANNGVLIYLLLADHQIEIVADRGLDELISPEEWQHICGEIEAGMRKAQPEKAIIAGIHAISDVLAKHFPAPVGKVGNNELPDQPKIL